MVPSQQAFFFTFAAPRGVCFRPSEGMLSLSAYWALMSLTPTLPLVPLLVIHLRHPSSSRPR
jgi:hypothetical protein